MSQYHNIKANETLKKMLEIGIVNKFKEGEKKLTETEKKQLSQIKKTLFIFMKNKDFEGAKKYCAHILQKFK